MNTKQYVAIILLLIVVVILVSIGAKSKRVSPPKEVETTKAEQTIKDTRRQITPTHSRELVREEDRPTEYGDLRFSFSKNEKNVVIITLDRALSIFFPYIMEELPEVKDDFKGFTYYPNTLSYGAHTIFGMPACYGGYEYTPEAMNKRDSELLKDKHNEALRLLPTLFSDIGYSVTVCDPPIANYEWVPDLSVFDDMKGVKVYNTIGVYDPLGDSDFAKFKDNYHVLDSLTKLTDNKSKTGAYISIDNETTHRYCYLSLPNYTIPENGYVNQWEYNWTKYKSEDEYINIYDSKTQQHYCVNAATLRVLGEWFRTLRRLGVYSNTKIIIAADHGYNVVADGVDLTFSGTDTQRFNPLLLVKDFNASGDFKTDETLMTNADVPIFATDGVIENATNPYTGNVLKDMVDKKEVHVYRAYNWQVEDNRGNTFNTANYFRVKDNIFDLNNWSTMKIYPGSTKAETTTAETIPENERAVR